MTYDIILTRRNIFKDLGYSIHSSVVACLEAAMHAVYDTKGKLTHTLPNSTVLS